MKKHFLAALATLLLAHPAFGEEIRYEGDKNPWLGVGMSLGAGVLTIPVGGIGVGAGYLYAGKPCKAVSSGLGSMLSYAGGFLLGATAYMMATNTWNSPQNMGAAFAGVGTGVLTAGSFGGWVLTDVYSTLDSQNKGLLEEGCL